MPARETGKQRSLRIPLDYFKRPDHIQTWKGRLGWLALAVTLIWLGTGFLQSDEGTLRYSRGPVAHVHAAWETECMACHVPFRAMDDHAWSTVFTGDSPTSSQRCQNCHSGPVHHVNQTPELGCAACHRDHRGREASLVRLPDSDCTQCHARVEQHIVKGKKSFLANGEKKIEDVTRFDQSHPRFRSIERDPGNLKFNHARHMEFLVRDLLPEARKRYGGEGKAESATVKLLCAACHTLEGGEDPLAQASRPARLAGAYMLPIHYETHCADCHPLTVDGLEKTIKIPHRLQPEEVREFLWGALAYQRAPEPKQEDQQRPFRPLPGKDRPLVTKKVEEIEAIIYKERMQLEKTVFRGRQTCGECHKFEPPAPLPPREVVATNVPAVWFRHARFNHQAHRAVDCNSCHVDAATSTKADDKVLVPDIDNCLQCHGPRTAANGKVYGGARFDCTECHSYHHRDQPQFQRMGLGARDRDPLMRMNIQDLLKGKK